MRRGRVGLANCRNCDDCALFSGKSMVAEASARILMKSDQRSHTL